MSFIFATLLTVLAIFLILLVLVQRGRGGGLTGALGGMGGSSAFGAKAGDVFTRITIVTAAIWIVVCTASVYWANHRGDRLGAIKTNPAPAGAPFNGSTAAPPTSRSDASDNVIEQPSAGTPQAETSTPVESGPALEGPAPPSEQPAPDAK